MKKICFLTCCLLTVLLTACQENHTARHLSIPYVERILSDTTTGPYSLLSSYNAADTRGSIVILGEAEDALLMTEAFLNADYCNNIDGGSKSDGLPDFAGETVAPLLDIANQPYDDYAVLKNTDFLKELTVRNFLFAMDTTCLQSPYDTLHPVRKAKAKIVVLASPWSGAFGMAEIDTLRWVANPGIKVISALDAVMDQAMKKGGRTVIWTTEAKRLANLYPAFFKHYLRARQGQTLPQLGWSIFAPGIDSLRDEGSLRSRFLGMLDDYMETHRGQRINSILLDDRNVDPVRLQAVIDGIKKTDEDALLGYKNILAQDCICISPWQAVTDSCYALMRRDNSFTHRIAYPAVRFYVTAPAATLPETVCGVDGSLTYSFKYFRESDARQKTYDFIEMRDRYIPEVLMEYMAETTPTTFARYVR